MTAPAYKRDVFVSYSDADLAWVESELLKRLRDARVNYIEPRDFKKGSVRVQALEDAIQSSRRTLLIVTRNYLSDAWTEFGDGLAFAVVLQTRTWSVVPVLTEDGLSLPPRLSALVPSNLVCATEDDWRRFMSSLFEDAPVAPPPPPPSRTPRTDLDLFQTLSKPEMQDALTDFRSDFEELCQGIGKLDKLKQLHDQFQDFEAGYNNIVRYAKGDSSGVIGWDDIEFATIDLQTMVPDIVQTACDSSFAQNEDSWIQRLKRAMAALKEANTEHNADKLRKGSRPLYDILNTIPSKVNVRMVSEARALRLSSLIRVLMLVYERLVSLGASSSSPHLSKIKNTATMIDGMDRELRAILYFHDSLQEMDGDLRQVESSLDEDVDQVVTLAEDLKPKLELLCANNSRTWATDLANSDRDLRNSFLAADPEYRSLGIKKAFRLFRRQAQRSFKQLDREMLRQCNELQIEIGGPLATLLALSPGDDANDQ